MSEPIFILALFVSQPARLPVGGFQGSMPGGIAVWVTVSNFAIVAGLLSALGIRLFGRARSFYFALTGIVLYMLFVGASGAVVRAAVMGALYVWGVHLGRQTDVLNSTMAAALLMTIWNPHLLWDLGFQLSFAATLGLALFTDPLRRRFESLLTRLLPMTWVRPALAFLNEALVVTTAAQIAMIANSI